MFASTMKYSLSVFKSKQTNDINHDDSPKLLSKFNYLSRILVPVILRNLILYIQIALFVTVKIYDKPDAFPFP